jgi:hypothetical protein
MQRNALSLRADGGRAGSISHSLTFGKWPTFLHASSVIHADRGNEMRSNAMSETLISHA